MDMQVLALEGKLEGKRARRATLGALGARVALGLGRTGWLGVVGPVPLERKEATA